MTLTRSRSRRTGARGACLAAALVLVASLAACGPADTGLQRDTAHQLQEQVLGVTKAAAANDHAAALTVLNKLEADVAAAAGSGHISEERRRRITTSIAAVKADLTVAATATRPLRQQKLPRRPRRPGAPQRKRPPPIRSKLTRKQRRKLHRKTPHP